MTTSNPENRLITELCVDSDVIEALTRVIPLEEVEKILENKKKEYIESELAKQDWVVKTLMHDFQDGTLKDIEDYGITVQDTTLIRLHSALSNYGQVCIDRIQNDRDVINLLREM